MDLEDFVIRFVVRTCPTIEDYDDLVRVSELYRKCVMGDKDACEILEKGCKWGSIGKS